MLSQKNGFQDDYFIAISLFERADFKRRRDEGFAKGILNGFCKHSSMKVGDINWKE
jgi:hypothetical protein